MVFDVTTLMPAQEYARRMGSLLDELRASPLAPGGKVRIPGEHWAQTREELDRLAAEAAIPPLVVPSAE